MSTDILFQLKNIRKRFGSREVLRGAGFAVKLGEVLSILGPSGSGKTTLLRIADFLERPDAGELVFRDRAYDLTKIGARDVQQLRSRAGFVYQNYNLFRNLTALENISAGLHFGHGVEKAEARERASTLLKRVGLSGYEHAYPSALSGGQQQRVGIARAISADPDIIFMDEPTSALDPELVGGVRALVKSLAEEGRTMVIVTHDLAFARMVSDRLIFMDQGAFVEENDAETFFRSPKNERTRRFLSLLEGATSDYII